jgi:hypothetical protein
MDRAIPPVECGGAAFILGKIHVGLSLALECPDDSLRKRIAALLDMVTKDVDQLYYGKSKPTQNPDLHF